MLSTTHISKKEYYNISEFSINDIIEILENYRENPYFEQEIIYTKREITQILLKTLDYIKSQDKVIEDQDKVIDHQNRAIEKENADFKHKAGNHIRECEELQYQIESHWKNQIKNLENECMQKIVIIKYQKYFMLFVL